MTGEGERQIPRILGMLPGERTPGAGPLLVVIGGIHGNEPGGVRAIQRVFAALEHLEVPVRGRVVGLAGNREALARDVRYVDQDLNRLWTEEDLARLEREGPSTVEQREQAEILEVLRSLLEKTSGRVALLDLHSTSAEGSPFAIMSDSLQNRPLARGLGVPILLGIEERVPGTLLSWFSESGHVALCLEGGKSRLDSTVDHHVAAIWITLVSLGMVAAEDVPDLEEHRARLAEPAWGLPSFTEVHYRFEVPEGSVFQMERGYTNFHLIRRGELLAHLVEGGRRREVRSPREGLLLMPLYQGQGADGFFVGQEVAEWALTLSAWVRRLRLGWVLPLLPGVHRDPECKRGLVVDRRIARWRTVEILHLFGYRRYDRRGSLLYFLRRPDALWPAKEAKGNGPRGRGEARAPSGVPGGRCTPS